MTTETPFFEKLYEQVETNQEKRFLNRVKKDVKKIQKIFQKFSGGETLEDQETFSLWSQISERDYGEEWRTPPKDQEQLYEIIVKNLIKDSRDIVVKYQQDFTDKKKEEIERKEWERRKNAQNWEEEVKLLSRERRNEMVKNYEEHAAQLDETIHYAKQDLEYLFTAAGMDLSKASNRQEAQKDLDNLNRELEDIKKKMSYLRSL